MATAGVLLAELTSPERRRVREQASHVREVPTGYRAGAAELAQEGVPRREYAPDRPPYERYAANAAEVGDALRTVQRWVRSFQEHSEVCLVPRKYLAASDPVKRWINTGRRSQEMRRPKNIEKVHAMVRNIWETIPIPLTRLNS